MLLIPMRFQRMAMHTMAEATRTQDGHWHLTTDHPNGQNDTDLATLYSILFL